jgi:serine-type D-Ala-D-Ala carboxypeptidase (penicillin-binding protein 5/6)
LIQGLLIESGADAAETLAVATSGSENHFVALMNEKAKQFGLLDTQFTNSVGRDGNGHYATAKDLAMLGRIALSNKIIANTVSKKTAVVTTEAGKNFYLSNTNLLLSDSSYKGLKTGTTYSAGECLISYYNDGTRRIIGVVITSPDRFGETKDIIEWTKRTFSW